MGSPSSLPRSAAAALRAGLGALHHVAETGSTNDDLAAAARAGDTSQTVLVADHQRAGKGRLGRRFYDAPGGVEVAGTLLVSLRLQTTPAEAFDRSAAVAAAALTAVAEVLGSRQAVVRSKWPNDLLLDGPGCSGKLAGMLSEFVRGEPSVVIVGLGMNLTAVPAQPGAVSLAQAGVDASRDEVLAALLDALPGRLADPDRARAELHAASATVGRSVRVQRSDGTVLQGVARAVDSAGRLVVSVDGHDVIVDAGDVHHLR